MPIAAPYFHFLSAADRVAFPHKGLGDLYSRMPTAPGNPKAPHAH